MNPADRPGGSEPSAADLAYESRALLRWPDAPDCRDWLGLDRRGGWRIQGAPIRHARTCDFLGRHYRCDRDGAWFVQNGPQRAFVTLAAAPWVLHLTGEGGLATHSGLPVRAPAMIVVTAEADVYLASEHGLGLLIDRDVAAFGAALCDAPSDAADDGIAALLGVAAANPPDCTVRWRDRALRCCHVADAALEATFGFRRRPWGNGAGGNRSGTGMT